MSDDFSLLAIIIAIVSVGIASLTFVLNWNQTKSQKLSSESQFINDIQKELDVNHAKIFTLETQEECILYAWSIINILDRVCFFETTGRLHGDIIEYFTNYLQLGYRYYNWLIKVQYSENDMAEWFPYFLKTCEKHSIKEDKRIVLFINLYDVLPKVK